MNQMTVWGTISLQGMIDALKQAPKDNNVLFDFGDFAPGNLMSYRGYYEHLALGYRYELVTAKALLAVFNNALGGQFDGYKGGTYTMHADTPIWVANWGNTSNTGIVSVTTNQHETVINTAWVDH